MSTRSPRPPPGKKVVVLVVDDENALREFTAEILIRNGYEVLQARHGQDAIAQLRAHPPDLIVLDLNMPVMDGWEFLSEQRRMTDRHLTAIPVLVVTGEEDCDGLFGRLDTAGLVQKPIKAAQLLMAVATALQH